MSGVGFEPTTTRSSAERSPGLSYPNQLEHLRFFTLNTIFQGSQTKPLNLGFEKPHI